MLAAVQLPFAYVVSLFRFAPRTRHTTKPDAHFAAMPCVQARIATDGLERSYEIPVGSTDRGKCKLRDPASGKANFPLHRAKALGETSRLRTVCFDATRA